jgi:DNA-binding winged helix-turn-helix (wHTH) protein
LTAKSTGLKLAVIPDKIAEKTAKQWEVQDQTVNQHLAAIRRILDDEEPGYRL